MKFLIVYSSKTGNTKKVAEALARVAPIGSEIHSIEEAGDADGFDVIFAGYWLDRGGVDEKMKKYLRTLHKKKIVLFETMGADPESEHAIIGFANAAMVLPEGNTVIGVFALQGEINPALLETMRTMGITTPHCGPEMEKCAAQAVGQPNKVDLEKAETYMKSFSEKCQRYFV